MSTALFQLLRSLPKEPATVDQTFGSVTFVHPVLMQCDSCRRKMLKPDMGVIRCLWCGGTFREMTDDRYPMTVKPMLSVVGGRSSNDESPAAA